MKTTNLATLMTLGMYTIPAIIIVITHDKWIQWLLIAIITTWGYITNKTNLSKEE